MVKNTFEKQKAEIAIMENEEKLKSFINNSPDTIYLLNLADHTTEYFNKDEFLGYSLAELNQEQSLLKAIHPDDSQIVHTHWQQIISGNEQGEILPVDYRIQHKNGDWVWIHQRVTVLTKTEQGVPSQLVVTLSDITERKLTEQTLEEARNALEQRVKERTQELALRIDEVETLNQAMGNMLTDLRDNQFKLETAQSELQAAHQQLKEEHVHEQAALLNLSQGLLRFNDEEDILNFALQETIQALHVEFAAVTLEDTVQKNFRIHSWVGWPPEFQIDQVAPIRSNSAMETVIRTKSHRSIPDIYQIISKDPPDNEFQIQPFISKMGISSALLVPLISGDQAIGGLAIHERETRQWTEDETRLLSLIANTTAQAIVRARSFKAEQTARTQAESVEKVAQIVSASLDLKTILRAILDQLGQVLPHDTASILIARLDHSWEMVVSQGFNDEAMIIEKANVITIDSPILNQMLKDLQPVIIPDVRQHEGWIWIPGAEHVRSFMAVPLITRNQVVGVLMVDSIEINFYAATDLQVTQTLVQHIAQAIDNALLFQQVEDGRRRLVRLSQRLVEVQEGERHRIARELHDEVGQILTALTISLDSISQITVDEMIQGRIDDFQCLIQELITQINILSTELRPRVLDDLGLEAGLAALISRLSIQTQLQIDFQPSQIERKSIPPVVEINAYRLVQEALTNVIRHAGVQKASVYLWMDPETLWIQIQDKGGGFDLQSALKSDQSMGLAGMTERVDLAGGILNIETSPGEGTSITAGFPLGKQPLERRKNERGENF